MILDSCDPMNGKLPKLMLHKIFSYLERQTVIIIRETHNLRISLSPGLPDALKQFRDMEYQHFLRRNGRLFRGLIIRSFQLLADLHSSGLSLSALFPNLRSLSISIGKRPKNNEMRNFIGESLSLKKLRHLSLLGQVSEGLMDILCSVNALDSLHVDQCPKGFFERGPMYKRLKTLSLSWKSLRYTEFVNLKRIAFADEVVLLDNDRPIISSSTNPAGSSEWVQLQTDLGSYYLKLSPGNDKKSPITDIRFSKPPVNIFPGFHYFPSEAQDILSLSTLSAPITHCAVANCNTEENDIDILLGLEHVPSLDIVFDYRCGYFELLEEKFQATKLSLKVVEDEFYNFFYWAHHSFPNLQHLYISNVIGDDMLPLQLNLFPNLTNFYSKAEQTEVLYFELITAAPKLLCIHSDYTPNNLVELKMMNPLLKFRPYENILRSPCDIKGVSGFNKYLFR